MRFTRRPQDVVARSVTVVDAHGSPVVKIRPGHEGALIELRLSGDPTTGVDLVALPSPDGIEGGPILGVRALVAGDDHGPDVGECR
jgi:hypothetical protein